MKGIQFHGTLAAFSGLNPFFCGFNAMIECVAYKDGSVDRQFVDTVLSDSVRHHDGWIFIQLFTVVRAQTVKTHGIAVSTMYSLVPSGSVLSLIDGGHGFLNS